MFRTIQSHEIYLLFLNVCVYNARVCVSYICVYVFYKTYFSTLLIFSYIPIHLLSRQNSTQAHTLNHTATFLIIIFQLVLSFSNYFSLSFSLFPSISFNVHSLPPFSPCSLITVIWKTIEVYKRHPLMTVNALKTNAIIFLCVSIYSIYSLYLIYSKRKPLSIRSLESLFI